MALVYLILAIAPFISESLLGEHNLAEQSFLRVYI